MPDIMLQSPPAWFFIFPPPVWDGICRTARHGCLNTLQPPFTPQLSPDAAPAAVFSGRGIIITRISGQDATAAPCRGCRSYFSFFYYDSSSYLYKSTATCFPQTNISPRSSPLITYKSVPNVLCPYILIFSSRQI